MEIEVKKKVHKTLIGAVISNKMEKTLVVEVARAYQNDRLHKVMRTKKSYKVHYDGAEPVHVGDVVAIREGRPVSKTKYMYLEGIISRQQV